MGTVLAYLPLIFGCDDLGLFSSNLIDCYCLVHVIFPILVYSCVSILIICVKCQIFGI